MKESERVGSFQPHQLDYDWRFAKQAVAKIAGETKSECVLLLGCPTLVVPLQQLGRRGVLVERNPNYVSTSGFKVVHADLRFERPTDKDEGYDFCIVDPPWYPQEFLSWMNTGLSMTKVNGTALFTLWPASIRPFAEKEHQAIFGALSTVGTIEGLGSVNYELPMFEEITLRKAELSFPQREGLFFKFIKRKDGQLNVPPFEPASSKWLRFTISGEQVAIKTDQSLEAVEDDRLFEIEPLTLHTTSRRDPILSTINIWTSQNVVARLAHPSKAAQGITMRDEFYLRMLTQKMKMKFDLKNIKWGVSWQHRT